MLFTSGCTAAVIQLTNAVSRSLNIPSNVHTMHRDLGRDVLGWPARALSLGIRMLLYPRDAISLPACGESNTGPIHVIQ